MKRPRDESQENLLGVWALDEQPGLKEFVVSSIPSLLKGLNSVGTQSQGGFIFLQTNPNYGLTVRSPLSILYTVSADPIASLSFKTRKKLNKN